MTGPHVLVMAKAPVSGRVKTRLCPPCTPQEASALAEASLVDTLEAVTSCGAQRRILALDGEPGPWLPPGFEVIAQEGDAFDERLARAWMAAGGPGVQIGMDTPQLTADLLDAALGEVDAARPHAALLGHAEDGGWWGIGLRTPEPGIFVGVPMSTDHTGRDQQERLRLLGFEVSLLPTLADFDVAGDLVAIARAAPASRTAALARKLGLLTEVAA